MGASVWGRCLVRRSTSMYTATVDVAQGAPWRLRIMPGTVLLTGGGGRV